MSTNVEGLAIILAFIILISVLQLIFIFGIFHIVKDIKERMDRL